ncbi:MAG: Molybdopterin-guanine dinucleotide biosynthesis protein B [Spirochaetes bacterium]|nr:MAG: Molybdopterin-guanine dinucleotide biosynthesis protein B [Spirochaetota bacterium]
MKGKPTIVSILGWSGVGKTTFAEKVIAECARRNIPVAAFKKSRHPADLPPGGKDSTRFYAAGADPSVYLSGSEMLLLGSPPPTMDKSAIASLCPRARIVVCEGLEVEGSVLVLVAGDETQEEALKRRLADIDILVARAASMRDLGASRGVSVFEPDSVGFFLDHIISLEESDD